MKKAIKVLLIALALLFIGVKDCYAEELNCNYVLRKGSYGNKVKALQRTLNEKIDCKLEVDGSFGKLTKACVIKYQQANNLDTDGIVGPKTCGSLNGTITESAVTSSSNSSTTSSDVVTEYKNTKEIYAIVLNSKVNLRSKSNKSSKIIQTVSRGTKVEVISTTNGWSYVNVNGTYGYIKSSLISKNVVVVDISDQTLFFYKDGNLKWSTKVVTGNKGNHDTPVGNYTLSKANFKTKTYLRGRNDNGTRYKSYVDYWMPFILKRGIGFHDASWRESWEYNTTRFNGNGSHGCVNMQHEGAEKLYNEDYESIDVVVRD